MYLFVKSILSVNQLFTKTVLSHLLNVDTEGQSPLLKCQFYSGSDCVNFAVLGPEKLSVIERWQCYRCVPQGIKGYYVLP